MKVYLENQLVVCHNASFDMSVLRNTLSYYGLEWPSLSYCCTLVASKIFYEYLPSFKLNVLSKYLGNTSLRHHSASSDAVAAGIILSEISKEVGVNDIDLLAEMVGFTIGQLDSDGYKTCKIDHRGV